MRDALNSTGRQVYFSLCGWNDWYAPKGAILGNSWRIAGDCNGWDTIYNAIRINEPLWKFAEIGAVLARDCTACTLQISLCLYLTLHHSGAWNDPDMLVGSSPQAAVHNTPDQARSQFSLWSVMAAPLLIGSNILNLSSWDLETYTNLEVRSTHLLKPLLVVIDHRNV
jgi:alpha-galactosidase